MSASFDSTHISSSQFSETCFWFLLFQMWQYTFPLNRLNTIFLSAESPVHMYHFSVPQMESWKIFSPHLAWVTDPQCDEQLSHFSTCRLVNQDSLKHGSYSCCPKCDSTHSLWTHSTPCSCNWKEPVYSFHFSAAQTVSAHVQTCVDVFQVPLGFQ